MQLTNIWMINHVDLRPRLLSARFGAIYHFCSTLNLQLAATIASKTNNSRLNNNNNNYQQQPRMMIRLNQEVNGGAWCPMKPISAHNFGKEWIQVKLNRSHVISAIETQGRYGFGSGREYVTHYQIEYSRDSGKSWHKWRDYKGNYVSHKTTTILSYQQYF